MEDGEALSIRSYRPSDREAVREICAATGWMGEFDLKRIADEWIWAEYWTRYFTDVDPLFTWVIDRRGVGQVAGYLTGLPDVRCFERYIRRIIPGIVRRVIRGRLMQRAESRGAILGMLRSLLRGEARVPEAVRARVELLHMVPVPRQVPLRDAGRYMLSGKEGIIETMLYLAPQFPISTNLRYCRNPARGIVSAVREKKIDMLILGWRGGRRARPFVMGSTIDPVIERTPCDVVILKDCGGNRKFNRILVPLAGGPNSALALEIASILADPDQGRIVAFTVNHRREFDVSEFVSDHSDRLHVEPGRVSTKTVDARNVTRAILREARRVDQEYDLVVLGATGTTRLRQMATNPIPETVAKNCTKPLIIVKAGGGVRSWIKRWI